jgi:hypothetical protein
MSNNLGLSQVAASQNQKEVTINDQAGELDAALTDKLAIAIDSTNARSLTSTELRRHFFFDLDPDGGDPPDAAITLAVPSGISRGLFAVVNDTGFDVTIEITGQALMPPTIADGEAALLTSDGVNVRLAGGGPAVIDTLGDVTDVVLSGLAQGHMLRRNGANEWVNEESPYDLSFFLPGTYSGGALMAQIVLDHAVTFPDGLVGAQGYSGVNATATTVLDLQKNGANAGTIMARFRDIGTLQKFTSAHASIHNHFSLDRHLTHRSVFKQNRSAALAEWRQLAA